MLHSSHDDAADALDRLIRYVLTDLDPADRAYIIDQLQHVAPDQQWGVWGSNSHRATRTAGRWSRVAG